MWLSSECGDLCRDIERSRARVVFMAYNPFAVKNVFTLRKTYKRTNEFYFTSPQ